VKRTLLVCIGSLLVAGILAAAPCQAAGLFKDRRIYLSNDDNRAFRIGMTGTTAGENYIALIEDAREETISLGDLGYWELVPDPPSFLRNYDLQLVVRNRAKGRFQVLFEYDRHRHDIRYRVKEGAVALKLDASDYYPVLTIESVAQTRLEVPADGRVRMVFFDFNSFDVDLRKHYGGVKRVVGNPGFIAHFYYYEAGNYDSYYFKTMRSAAELDTEKMGLSTESGELAYYQKVLDNIKARHGADFADEMILVTRFGPPFADALKKYAGEIGLSDHMALKVWSYDDLE